MAEATEAEAPAADMAAEAPAAEAEAPPPAVEPEPEPAPPAMPEPAPAAEPEPAPEPEPEPAPAALREDLTRIEGIGPAIANALQEAGVTTFQELADTKADRVREILRDAGIRGGDPTTWAQQAKLAAAGDWVKLKRLQDRLTGGRRA